MRPSGAYYAGVMSDPVETWRSAYQHPTQWEQDFPPLSLPETRPAPPASPMRMPRLPRGGSLPA